MISVKIIHYTKSTIRNPENEIVKETLVRLGYPVERVSIGREILVDINTDDATEALDLGKRMTEQLLVNTILCDYDLVVVE